MASTVYFSIKEETCVTLLNDRWIALENLTISAYSMHRNGIRMQQHMRVGIACHIKTGMTVAIDIEHEYVEDDIFL
jgi:hypothetical protein